MKRPKDPCNECGKKIETDEWWSFRIAQCLEVARFDFKTIYLCHDCGIIALPLMGFVVTPPAPVPE
jgi:hypothetical protein